MRTIQFVELDPFCQHVLRQHWPDVPIHGDVRTFHAAAGFADVICGGFPCQDISVAGKGAGLAGERSGLWTEYARLIGEVRPRYVIVENVSVLRARGLERVLGDLATLRYDAEWHCIPASAVGAPHIRDRIWVVAYPGRDELWDEQQRSKGRRDNVPNCRQAESRHNGEAEPLADADGSERRQERQTCDADREQLLCQWEESPARPTSRSKTLADSYSQRQLRQSRPLIEIWRWLGDCGSEVSDSYVAGLEGCEPSIRTRQEDAELGNARWWATEPDVGRMAHGVPARVDRLRSLGNAVVPQIPEIIGRAIMRHANER